MAQERGLDVQFELGKKHTGAFSERTDSMTLSRMIVVSRQIGFLSVLHTWGQTLVAHPHLHCVVPGGGISLDGSRWVACRPGFFLPVKVLSRRFRKLYLRYLEQTYAAGKLQFYGELQGLSDPKSFARYLTPLHDSEWVVYAKRPFAGPKAVLSYLARYTHRVAISNSRLIASGESGVTFKYKDYRVEGPERYKTMRLATHEFIRRFLLHVLPSGFHRIRHYGLLANGSRKGNIAKARALLAVLAVAGKDTQPLEKTGPDGSRVLPRPCPCCGGRMIVIEVFARGATPRHRPTAPTNRIRIDTS